MLLFLELPYTQPCSQNCVFMNAVIGSHKEVKALHHNVFAEEFSPCVSSSEYLSLFFLTE